MSTFTVSPDDLRRLAALVEENNLTELRYEQGDVRITLRTATYFREQQRASVATVATMPGVVNASLESASATEEVETEAVAAPATPGISIEAPIMGVFYRSASPSDPPFVEAGDHVEIGQVLGLIEAMKVFSEVKAEVAGIVREITAENKALVQPGDVLLVLDEE